LADFVEYQLTTVAFFRDISENSAEKKTGFYDKTGGINQYIKWLR